MSSSGAPQVIYFNLHVVHMNGVMVQIKTAEARIRPKALLEFWYSLDSSYRAVINTRLRKTVGTTFEELALERPGEVYDALVKAIGPHNAGVFMIMYTGWLNKA